MSSANAELALAAELDWLERIVHGRMQAYFDQKELDVFAEYPPPDVPDVEHRYAAIVRDAGLDPADRLILILAMAPQVRPQILDPFFVKNNNFDRGFSEFGGWKGSIHAGFLPTAQTAAFLLAGEDLDCHVMTAGRLQSDRTLLSQNLLQLDYAPSEEPFLAAKLVASPDLLARLFSHEAPLEHLQSDLPAQRMTTSQDWSDLVLSGNTLETLQQVLVWIERGEELIDAWGLQRVSPPGVKALFVGPPGTGKTMTAGLLGKASGREVYRIDLSQVVSKYIGETEKNLSKLFSRAQLNNWVLFFDEADALFGKRTAANSANDRYANQEVSYLLQRMETYRGVVILATNLNENIDDAFARRFHYVVGFSMPGPQERLRLWLHLSRNGASFAGGVDPQKLADDFELSGGAMINVMRYAVVCCAQRNEKLIAWDDLQRGIARELKKEGRTI